jgi:oligopeptide transport system substrate-binding protein
MIRPLLLLCALALILAGCDNGSGDRAVSVSVIGAQAKMINPSQMPLDAASAVLVNSVGQGLVTFDAFGQIEPALAERWVVTDDGLSYIFRIRRARWSDGTPVDAGEVAGGLRAALGAGSRNALRPLLSTVTDIVAMTDRVIEIRLRTPQPSLLELLAAPEMAVLRGVRGTGPYRVHRRFPHSYVLRPALAEGQSESDVDPDILRNSERRLRGEQASLAIARFMAGDVSLVLGGSFNDLPIALAARPPGGTLRRDPTSGLFGLVVAPSSTTLATADMRKALAMAIDRRTLLDRFRASGWSPIETILPGPIDGTPSQAAADWIDLSAGERLARARDIVSRANKQGAVLRVALPPGPGGHLLLAGLAADWAKIGIKAIRVNPSEPADLRLVDAVAPYKAALWYLGRFGCDQGAMCSPAADRALSRARSAEDIDGRSAALTDADEALASAQLFIPLAVPLRWSLVATRLPGYAENAHGIHPLNRLRRAVQ